MREIVIKKANLPQRCEICHQSDKFNPINNSCDRCVGISYRDNSGSLAANDINFSSLELFFQITAKIFASLFIIGFSIVVFEIIGLALLFFILDLFRRCGIGSQIISLVCSSIFIFGSFILAVYFSEKLMNSATVNNQTNLALITGEAESDRD